MSTRNELIAAGVIAVLLILVALNLWEKYSAPRPAGSVSVIAAVSPALRKAPTAKVPIKAPVTVYRGQTKANLKLPAAVIADEHREVVAASQVAADLHPQTVSTVINTETGAVETFVKTDPYPWLAIEARGEISGAYGYKFKSGELGSRPVARLQVKYDLLRVKALTVGAVASVDSDRDAFAGIGVSYKF